MGAVYKITNLVNQKAYIGITKHSVGFRWTEHCACARLGRSQSKSVLHDAIKKYGEDSFLVECLQTEDSWEALQQLEQQFIAQFDTLNTGYNLTAGGQGHRWTEQQKKQLSHSITGRKMSDAAKAAISEGAKRWANEPKERALRSERAKHQHASKSLGAHTWTPEGRKRVQEASAHGPGILLAQEAAKKTQTSAEMSRRSYLRKIFHKDR